MKIIKKIIWFFLTPIDHFFLSGRISRYSLKLYIKDSILMMAKDTPHRILVHYAVNQKDPLALLCDFYGTDKGESEEIGHPYNWVSHSYADYYSRIFSHCRSGVKKVFECGIGTNNPNLISSMGSTGKPGASLRVWRDYFPNALVFGGDIDQNILFEEDRIKTFYVDQCNTQSIQEFWKLVATDNFDFMIDDGLHTFEAGATLFQYSIDKLSTHGIYVIEDVSMQNLPNYKVFFDQFDYVVDYVILEKPKSISVDNNLIVVRRK